MALCSLDATLKKRYDVPLVIRRGKPAEVLADVARKVDATTCHVIADDVEGAMRAAQRAGCAALRDDANVRVQRWDGALRGAAPWNSADDVAAAVLAVVVSLAIENRPSAD